MELAYDPDLPHQAQAIAAIVELFAGMPRDPPARWVSVGGAPAVANPPHVRWEGIFERLAALQRRRGLTTNAASTPNEAGLSREHTEYPNFSVEMETGTGKTYVFLRTALELHRRYRFSKFVVVVPSVAVREAVLGALHSTHKHFLGLFPGIGHRFFAYDRARLHQLEQMSRSYQPTFMVTTIDAFNKSTNVLRKPMDRFGGSPPIELLRAVRPVLIIDEPHHVETEIASAALAELDPLFAIRYGATHRRYYNVCHRLTPRRAHELGLVKSIEVAPSDSWSSQIRLTIATHLRRQTELLPRGIKVLSLFFLQRVDDYAAAHGEVRRLFDRHFDELKRSHPLLGQQPAATVRAAYFAERKRGGARRSIDSSGHGLADADAYQLILRDKARLLSLGEPVAFLFSHSALREGWDNPNVFQICTLGRAHSSVRKRQEIGRGLRLCVDQQGRRVLDPAIDVLRVIANESYEAYVAALQAETTTVFEPAACPPRPRRVGETGSVAMLAMSPKIGPRVVTAAMVARARVKPEGPWETRPAMPLPNVIDLVVERLAWADPPLLIRRVLVLELCRRTPDLAGAVRAPIRWAEAIAHAVTEAAQAEE